MPVEIDTLAQECLTAPVQVKVGKVSRPTANVSQVLRMVSDGEKIDCLLALLVDDASQAENSRHPLPLTVVFVERKARCDEVAEALVAQGLRAVALHGGRSQSEREAALNNFRNGFTNILLARRVGVIKAIIRSTTSSPLTDVATDVATCGLDVTGVAHVINLDLPKTMEDYVHRIGRTGHAGAAGQATSFYTDRDLVLVVQIKKVTADVESGSTMTFAIGKISRKKEREAAAGSQKDSRNGVSKFIGSGSINIEDKYRFMISSSNIKVRVADSAWDD